ncbi:MAG: DEAD/DEAH box helicase, partial [Eubacteriales bacterium]|nr:DEAD/DEAH box helicase [Eubacteriales bacterium]
RAAYMVSMLRMAGAQTETDAEAENAIESLGQTSYSKYMPQKLHKKLSPYQLRGSDWLLSLYEAHMGGILADEMGLGKTLQVIAALSAAKRKEGTKKSIIVTPTSLTYHWLAELKRFDDSLIVRVITGQREERRHAIRDMKLAEDVDVVLTSYPLLRRDIQYLKDIPMRFAVLDEAQSVKNAQSQGALAAKELDAQVRIALTGTPMENHTGELWSIFDFVLPGYLGTQASFLRRYGGGEHAEELRERIRPFLMRRLKNEVLSDLPEKREQYLYAAMPPEQERVYNTLLNTLRQHVGQALEDGSLPKARMQVLSILLKLRQVCCHPKLFLSDYEGTSGKLELLVQTVHSAINSGRRMLVFSQFVGMLQMIKKRLAREGVQTLYLDGETKPILRQQLCDRFNGGDGKVFLISLKAGGTGLNLTGADLVIHFDPWWNPAAEDQATDRAHRIGQTKDVDVIKLIAQGTIEEKVTDLSKRKRAIFDRVVNAGETALSSLTEEDIRALFFT